MENSVVDSTAPLGRQEVVCFEMEVESFRWTVKVDLPTKS